MSVPLDPIATVDFGIKSLEKVRNKLVTHPDPAADRLVKVFNQLSAMYSSLDEALSVYCGIMLWRDMPMPEFAIRYRELSSLSPASLQAKFAESRAHCTVIENIYNKFLKNWFQRVLNHGEQEELRVLFVDKMMNYDDSLVRALDDIAYWLGNEAQQLKAAMSEEDWDAINQFLPASQAKAARLQEEIAKEWIALAGLRSDFAKISGATITG
jgi:hypothetical protein